MKVPDNGIYIDNPAYPLVKALISYWGITSSDGNAGGTTLICLGLASDPSYIGQKVKVLNGASAGQVRTIIATTTGATGTVTVDSPFTDNTDTVSQIVSGTRFVILSGDYSDNTWYYGTSTGAGSADGSTIVDTGLAAVFTVDDQCIGATVRIIDCTTASLEGQEREIYDYDFGASVLYFDTPFTSQVPINTTYEILRDRPSSGGGGPSPEPETKETVWQLDWYDNFDVADATADTEKWSSEYVSAGAADGTADINTTTASKLHVDITAAAVAAAEYGVRALKTSIAKKWFALVDAAVTVTNPNVNHVWAGMSVSPGTAWDANNYIRIYKRQNNAAVEGIATTYRLAGGAVTTTTILATTQDNVAFKIERFENVWRLFYSLSMAPRHHWILAQEIEDTTGAMGGVNSIYLSVYNPEDAAGQQIATDFDKFEHYYCLGMLADIYATASSDMIYYDSVNGVAGTALPVGTPIMPVNNWADLAVIMAARDIYDVKMAVGSTLTATTATQLHLIGDGSQIVTISANTTIDGTLDVHSLEVSAGIALIVHGDVFVSEGITNTTGTISIWGNVQTGAGLGTTTGAIVINGNVQIGGLLTSTDTTGNITVTGNCIVGANIENTSTATITIGGNCLIQTGALINSGAGNVDIEGSLDVNGLPGGALGYINNSGAVGTDLIVTGRIRCNYIANTAGTISAFSDVQTYGSFTTTTGEIRIGGDAHVGGGFSTTTGAVNVYGDIFVRDTFTVSGAATVLVSGKVETGGTLTNVGTTFLGSLNCQGELINTGAVSITIRGDCYVYGGITNTTGIITIIGNCHVARLITTTGAVTVGGNFFSTGELTASGAATVIIYGKAEVGGVLTNVGTMTLGSLEAHEALVNTGAVSLTIKGEAFVEGNITNTTGTIDVYGNLITTGAMTNTTAVITINKNFEAYGFTQNNTGTLTVYGSIKLVELTNSNAGGTVSVLGDAVISSAIVNVGGITFGSLDAKSTINNTGAVEIIIKGDCFVVGAVTNTTGIITVYGNCRLSATISTTTGDITVDGDFISDSTVTSTGTGDFIIKGNAKIASNVVNNSGGTITISGDCFVGGTISNNNAGSTFAVTGLSTLMNTVTNAGTLTINKTHEEGNSFRGSVTAATSVTSFSDVKLAGFGNDFFVNWWVTCDWDAVGAHGAPQGEWQQITDYVSNTGAFTHAAFTAQLALTDKVRIISPEAYSALATIASIFSKVNALLVLTETGGTLTATGGEDNVYINNAPAGVFKPQVVLIDLDAMTTAAGDVTAIKVYYRLKSAGGLQLYDYMTFTGDDGGLTDNKKVVAVTLLPNRFGLKVTLTQTAGVNKTYDWEVLYEA